MLTRAAPLAITPPDLERDYRWAVAAARAAADVPAVGAEAELWTVRGWVDVAVGCAVVGSAATVVGLDDVVRETGVSYGWRFAQRLRLLREQWGPVPRWYPECGPAPVEADGADRREAVRASRIVADFCDALAAVRGPDKPATWPADTGELICRATRYRPSPTRAFRVVECDIDPGLPGRMWMRLPQGATVLHLTRRPLGRAAIVRTGIHEGAHLDHLLAAPGPIEFGAGLLAAESYAMAVEILAAAECAARGEAELTAMLRAGLVERVGRLPGGIPERAARGWPSAALRAALATGSSRFAGLTTLADTYVVGPLRLLAGRTPILPPELEQGLGRRWHAVTDAFPGALALAEAVAECGWTPDTETASGAARPSSPDEGRR
ncbi:hypothetical protein [Micromonospora thermarum]|uniref:Uncharacterized protein n=1 Tax=Micromonospora thermarum TaxID=2720024 RepID=A0ABX0ZCR2_9ACTN|nr:hypothetical protein [Micromonospora thermarum]NJP33750.1 hypothetical protein [Micromonospora thermarum]